MNSVIENKSPRRIFHKFAELWNFENTRCFLAPGRVNLIGEHTDYNEGFVLPIALNYAVTIAASRRDDEILKIYSVNYDELKRIDLSASPQQKTNEWINYVEGMARVLREQNYQIGGANLFVSSDVPLGAGLSSSAAIEIASGLALLCLYENDFDKLKLALAAQRAEHEFVGTKSGIMDQYVSTFGKAGCALLIDCRSLESKAIRLELVDAELIVCNSGVKHSLASSEYNTRRAECEKGVEILKDFLPAINSLRDVSLENLNEFGTHLDDKIFRRCRHIVTENERTLKAAEAFENGDLALAGQLMNASHASLRDDYEVSCPELDLLAGLAENFDVVYGARMTGGGFGGCTINLVGRGQKDEFSKFLVREYESQTGIKAEIFDVTPSDGAAEIRDLKD